MAERSPRGRLENCAAGRNLTPTPLTLPRRKADPPTTGKLWWSELLGAKTIASTIRPPLAPCAAADARGARMLLERATFSPCARAPPRLPERSPQRRRAPSEPATARARRRRQPPLRSRCSRQRDSVDTTFAVRRLPAGHARLDPRRWTSLQRGRMVRNGRRSRRRLGLAAGRRARLAWPRSGLRRAASGHSARCDDAPGPRKAATRRLPANAKPRPPPLPALARGRAPVLGARARRPGSVAPRAARLGARRARRSVARRRRGVQGRADGEGARLGRGRRLAPRSRSPAAWTRRLPPATPPLRAPVAAHREPVRPAFTLHAERRSTVAVRPHGSPPSTEMPPGAPGGRQPVVGARDGGAASGRTVLTFSDAGVQVTRYSDGGADECRTPRVGRRRCSGRRSMAG